jgi:hypothetical protein
MPPDCLVEPAERRPAMAGRVQASRFVAHPLKRERLDAGEKMRAGKIERLDGGRQRGWLRRNASRSLGDKRGLSHCDPAFLSLIWPIPDLAMLH